jgi:hypothetical protein
MRLFLVAATLLVPIITHAQPPAETRESTQRLDVEPAFGATLLGAGYLTSVLWSSHEDGDQDMLYVPVLGPWLELFSLPDCENRDVFCAHSSATRGVLITSGTAQLIGFGFLLHSIVEHYKEEPRVLVAPTYSHGPGVSLRGRF